MNNFNGDLAITLSLTMAGQTHAIPPGNVKTLALELFTYGFMGKIGFVVSSELATDTLFTPMTQSDLITVTLQVGTYSQVTEDGDSPLKLTGLVRARGFTEQTLSNILKTQATMLYRHYHLEFADPAQVLWQQHFPCDLLTNTTLQALITAHTPSQITMTYDWDVLQTQYPVLSLPLGAPGNQASFYDFILWLVDSRNGAFTYDTATNTYTLSASKSQDGTASSLDPLEVGEFGVEYQEVCRYQPKVLNAYSESPQTTPITNAQMASPIRRDFIARYPIAADMQARVTLETARMKQHMHEVWVDFQAFQGHVTPPGQLVDFKSSSAWNASIFVQPNTYRVKQWRLSAQAVEQDDSLDMNNAFGSYDMSLHLQLECKEELCLALPNFVEPLYPFYVEGKIVSEKGGDTDATYQFYTDDNTSINYYQIKIPLWDNKLVRAAYQPNFDGGQFYFPPYKNARVLVGLGLDNALIAAFLDWGVRTALPLDSQGNQLVMGTSPSSQNIIKHTYEDSKPKLQIQRTLDKDTELLQFSDGYIILQTQQTEGE